ncbi:uncharacterized protein [Ptychodera flava]|uniref:uncharacterized protein n=1 Tax=Ptychodera flava TaxID=63121 RepID=UPI00396A9A46
MPPGRLRRSRRHGQIKNGDSNRDSTTTSKDYGHFRVLGKRNLVVGFYMTKQKMYCKQCRSAYGQLAVNKVAIARTSTFYSYSKGPFVIGSENFRHSSLVAHAQSKGHSVAIEHVKHRTAPCGTSSAEMALQKMNESVFSKLTNLFRNAHSICVNSRSFKDYVWMSSLDVMKGVEVGETYRNDKACRQFITAISQVERERLQNETSDNKFISIIKATPNHRFGPKAKALSQLMTSKSVVFYDHFLQDILATLSSLSIQLQQRDSSIYTCHEQLKVTITSLQKLETILW